MDKLAIAGIFILMLLVISGYVSSEDAHLTSAQTTWHVDPHLNYYDEHLSKMGIERREL